MGDSDKELVQRFLALKDHAAFKVLVERHYTKVTGLLMSLTSGNHHDSKDMAQEVFIRMYKHLATFAGKASLQTWLFRISYNVFHDFCLAKKKHDQHALALEYEPYDSVCPSERIDFHKLLSLLNEQERWAMTLHYERGLSHGEIAEVMNCPLGTAKSYIQRGLDKLKAQVSL